MKTENIILMQMARESLKGKWGLAIGGCVVFSLISIVLSFIPIFGSIGSLIITGPFTLGIIIFSLSISRNQEAKVGQIFDGFNYFGKSLGAYLLVVLFVLLWSLLLIIPGIIAAISYSMTFYILADNPSIKAMEAIDRSKKMMYGYKWKLVCLQFRFIGWMLLCFFTLGIGLLWLIPYMQISFAKFYDDIKGEQIKTEENPEIINPVVI
jgi:uncharacterized membrane protein